jgi:hypothetical protein
VRLYGDELTPGVIDRFDAYLGALDRLGRRHGVRLDLRRRDPIIAPMWRALVELRRRERDLRRPAHARRDTAPLLRSLDARLNGEGYQALGAFVRRIGALVLTPDLLQAIDARVRGEAALEGESLPVLRIEMSGSVPVRIFRGDLEDVASNLLRNGYRAVVEGVAPDDRRMAVRVREAEDPATGIEEVVIAFFDNAPGTLTTEMIRARNIGRGLGLALDLVTRHDGTLSVRPISGGKEVEVHLPRAEAAP